MARVSCCPRCVVKTEEETFLWPNGRRLTKQKPNKNSAAYALAKQNKKEKMITSTKHFTPNKETKKNACGVRTGTAKKKRRGRG